MSLEFKEAPEGHRGGAGVTFLESHRRKPAETPQRNTEHLQLGMGLWDIDNSRA